MRDQYKPLQSKLCAGSNPIDIVQGVLSLYPFSYLYIADLDALMGQGSNWSMIQMLIENFPDVEFWVDQGLVSIHSTDSSSFTPVLGSESIDQAFLDGMHQFRQRQFILSLDFSEDRLLGPESLLTELNHWPDRTIIMSLGLVGSNAGPDWARLGQFLARCSDRHIFSAGGTRSYSDLLRLDKMGVSGVLLASALHSGALKAGDLSCFE